MHKCQKMIGTPVKGESEREYILKKAAPGVDVAKNDFSTTVFGGLDVVDLRDWNPIGTGSMNNREDMAKAAESGKKMCIRDSRYARSVPGRRAAPEGHHR